MLQYLILEGQSAVYVHLAVCLSPLKSSGHFMKFLQSLIAFIRLQFKHVLVHSQDILIVDCVSHAICSKQPRQICLN